MRSIFLILTSCFLFLSAHGKMSNSILTYYRQINQAELFLLDSNYNSAIKHFRAAFKHKSNPFIKDRFNLALCYALENNYRKCYEHLRYVVDKGASIYQLKKTPTLSDFFNSGYGYALVSYHASNKRTYNYTYRAMIDSLVKMDQKFRNMKGSYAVYGDTIRKIDSLNVITLNRLIVQYGFPSEDLIGIDTSLALFRPIYNVILIHQQLGAQNHFWDYTDLVTYASDHGQIEVHAAAEYIWKCSGKDNLGVMDAGLLQLLLDTNGQTTSSSLDPPISTQPYGYFKLTPEKENAANERRESIGLEPLHQARLKTAFVQIDTRFKLPSSTVSVLICTSQSQYNQMVKSVNWIK